MNINIKLKGNLLKILFYMLSNSLLFLLLAILNYESIKSPKFIVFFTLFIICFLPYFFIRNIFKKDSKGLPIKIFKYNNINFEIISFFITFIVPLVYLPLKEINEIIVFILLLSIIIAIFFKTSLFYTNPILSLFGYSIYQIEKSENTKLDNCILILKGKLVENSYIRYVRLDETIYYGEVKNCY